MKRNGILLVAALLLMTACSEQGSQFSVDTSPESRNGVIYGKDSVKSISDKKLQGSDAYVRNLTASVALIKKTDLKRQGEDFFINDKTVEERYRTCPDFRFSSQISAAFCSGILVAPQVVLTAAHCMKTYDDRTCALSSFVFGYSSDVESRSVKTVGQSQVYRCQKILAINDLNTKTKLDYALVQLDRPVEGVDPVSMPETIENPLNIEMDVYTVGYPIGTTKKLARGFVREFSKESGHPLAALDVYFGNSGSPIFNGKTNELVGLLSRGEDDFIETKKGCQTPKKCPDGGCLGETLIPLEKIINDAKGSLSSLPEEERSLVYPQKVDEKISPDPSEPVPEIHEDAQAQAPSTDS